MSQLVVLGSVNVDHLLQVVEFPRPGETVPVQHYQTVPGGKGANQAVAAARLGAQTRFIACIGDDSLGGEMRQGFAADGIDISAVMAVPDQSTGMAMIYVDSHGENNIGIWPGANAALLPERLTPYTQVIASADILLMQLESPLETIQAAADIARQGGTRVVLNPAPGQALPAELLQCIDLITPNETEAEIQTGIHIESMADADKAARALHDHGIETVLITLGKRGVWLSEQGRGQHVPGFVVEAKDTTAAGDTFNGALVTAMLEGRTLEAALPFAQAAAAISVTRLGAQTSIPSRAEVDRFLADSG